MKPFGRTVQKPTVSGWVLRSLRIGLIGLFCQSALAQQGQIESVAPGDLEARLLSHKGTVVVNITSTDPRCGYCIRANAKYQALAEANPDLGTYLQTSWTPWSRFPESITGFLKKHSISGIPARLVYRDGALIGTQIGEPKDIAPGVANNKPGPQRITGSIQLVPPAQISAYITKTPGTLVVELTSFEISCAFCMLGNPVFEDFSTSPAAAGAGFVRVVFTPWTEVVADPFTKALGITGLPTYLAYRDGKLVRRKNGIASISELQKVLLDGVQ